MTDRFYQQLCDNASDLIFCMTPAGSFVYVNRAWQSALGYTQEEAQALTLMDTVAPECHPQLLAFFQQALTATCQGLIETTLLTKQGVRMIIEGNIACEFCNGIPVTLQAIFRDVTERNRQEAILRESEERSRTVIAAMEAGVVLQYADGSIRACNTSAQRILGLTAEQLRGRTSIDPHWRSIYEDGTPFPDEDHPAMVVLRTGVPCADVVMGIHKPDGTLVWVSISSQPLFHRNQATPYAAVTSFVDITPRKQNEDALREREAQYRALFEHSLDAILLTVPDGTIIAANPEACRIFQRTEAEICEGGRALITDLADPRLPAALDERARTGRFRGELRFRRRDGTTFPCEISTAIFTDRNGHLRTSMMIRDITERKQHEQALRESEERFARVFRASPVGISITTLDEGLLLDINDSCLRMLGYEREEIIGRTVGDIGIWRQYDERAYMVGMLKEHGFHHNWGTQFVTKTGQVREALISVERIELKGQICLLTLVYDITEWKQLEYEREQLISELQAALANIKTLRGLIPICASCKNIRDDQGYWNNLESYLQAHTDADFSHGICPTCMQRLYPELMD